jgi:hypothetical protein
LTLECRSVSAMHRGAAPTLVQASIVGSAAHTPTVRVTAMQLLNWLAWLRWPWSPNWFQSWQRRQQRAELERTLMPAVLAAQADGVGISQAWAEPGTLTDEIMQWCDAEIRAAPGSGAASADLVRIMVAHCTIEEWQAAEAGLSVQLPSERHVISWSGLRTQWWQDGRAAIAAAVPDDHDGLFVAVNTVGAAFQAALQPPYRQR